MDLTSFLFWLFAIVLVVAALLVVGLRNIVHSALALIIVFLNLFRFKPALSFVCLTVCSPPLKIKKSSILFTICIDFCGERLQGLGVVSAEILQFYFGGNG